MEKEKKEVSEMSKKELINEYKSLKAENNNLQFQNKELQIKYNNATLEINALRRMVFGSKQEKTPSKETIDSDQISLFDNEEEIEKDVQEQIEEQVEEITIHKRKNAKKKVAGLKKSMLKDVVVKRQEYVLNEDEKCPECGSDFKLVSKQVVRTQIEFTPATFNITEYVQNVYKCTKCGTEESEKETPTFGKAEIPKALLAHSFVSPSLATEVFYQKYYLGVPFYRQEKMWDDKGLVLPRNMMANWSIKINEYYLEVLWKLMHKELKYKCGVLHSDETTLQVNKEPGRNATSNSYMWVLRSGELEKIKGVVFKYSQSRSSETAKEFLKDFKGIVVTDGYAGYNEIEEVTHAECWAHVRRYFYESVPLVANKMDTTATGYIGVEYCNKLFKIEEEIASLSDGEKQKKRQEESKPIVDEFFTWVNTNLNTKIVVNNKLKKALVYAQNQEKELSEFLNDGRIPLSNNIAERSIRPFAVHRKNWLFADTTAGAKANATYYSLIECAKINNLNIYKYMNYLLESLPQEEVLSEEILVKYLPWSEELPDDVRNYVGEYEELKVAE